MKMLHVVGTDKGPVILAADKIVSLRPMLDSIANEPRVSIRLIDGSVVSAADHFDSILCRLEAL